MKYRVLIIAIILFPIYLAIVLLTKFSLTGFWTDIILSIALSIIVLWLAFKNKTDKLWLTVVLRVTAAIGPVTLLALLIVNLNNPSAWDRLKTRSFCYQVVEGRLFNAYFEPVGAYASGYGNFWVTESPKYFPIIEWEVYWERAVHHDFRKDTSDGEPVDNYEVVRKYIKKEVVDK